MNPLNATVRRRLGKVLAAIGVMIAVLIIAAYFVLSSDWAKNRAIWRCLAPTNSPQPSLPARPRPMRR